MRSSFTTVPAYCSWFNSVSYWHLELSIPPPRYFTLYLRLNQRGISTLYLYSVFQPTKHIELITGTAGLSSERIAMFPQYRAHPLLSASAESDWDLRVVCYHLWFPLFGLLSSPAQFLVLGYSLRRSETYSFLNFVYVYYTWFLTFCQELFYAMLLKV